MRKTAFCICKNKEAVTAKLISTFVFAISIIQFLCYLNPKFQASSHLLWLYSPVCVGPGWKPRRPVFSQRGSYYDILFSAGQVGDECAILDLASCLDPNAQCSSATSPPTCACIDGFTHNVNTHGCDLRKLSFYPHFRCTQ